MATWLLLSKTLPFGYLRHFPRNLVSIIQHDTVLRSIIYFVSTIHPEQVKVFLLIAEVYSHFRSPRDGTHDGTALTLALELRFQFIMLCPMCYTFEITLTTARRRPAGTSIPRYSFLMHLRHNLAFLRREVGAGAVF